MERFFVTYEIAKELKEIGFNEEVIAHYNKVGQFVSDKCGPWKHNSGEVESSYTSAPLYDQVIDWFIEKHDIHIWVEPATYSYRYYILTSDDKYEGYKESDGRYKALSEGIKKAIELIKQKK